MTHTHLLMLSAASFLLVFFGIYASIALLDAHQKVETLLREHTHNTTKFSVLMEEVETINQKVRTLTNDLYVDLSRHEQSLETIQCELIKLEIAARSSVSKLHPSAKVVYEAATKKRVPKL